MEKKKILIDAHCHLFTKTMFTEDIANLVAGIRKNKIALIRRQVANVEERLIGSFMKMAYDHDSKTLYEYMKKQYDCDFIAVPLMIDFSFTMAKPFDMQQEETAGVIRRTRQELSMRSLDNHNRFIAWLGKMVAPSVIQPNTGRSIDFFKNNYQIQLNELIELKKAMPNRVFPFYSVDPRKDKLFDGGIITEIKKYVGKDKPFLGLKLYTGLGYSPTHPALFKGKNSVFAYCQRFNIPITAHFAEGGFAHVQTEAKIEGDIYYPVAGEVIPMREYAKDQTIHYENNYMGSTDDMIKERQLMHNHPKLWRKVLARYPRLKINFAHMGGSEQLLSYAMGEKKAYWTSMVISLMADYPNVYADLAAFNRPEGSDVGLEAVYEKIYKKMPRRVRRKVLYGSDFYMILLFRPSLKGYIIEFKRVFGDDFEKIAHDNPMRFLGLKPRHIK